eukprot:3279887-Rhodomonas_salina.1
MPGSLPGAVSSVTSPVARVLEDSVTPIRSHPDTRMQQQYLQSPAPPPAPYGLAPAPQVAFCLAARGMRAMRRR